MQFKDIVGQRDVINRLTEIIDSGRVSHAQLLLGDERDGSLALAWAYMQYLCCRNRQHYHDTLLSQPQATASSPNLGEQPQGRLVWRVPRVQEDQSADAP